MSTENEMTINNAKNDHEELKNLTWEQRNARIEEKLQRAINYISRRQQRENPVDIDML